MIDITKLYCATDTTGDPLRYGVKNGESHGHPHPTEHKSHEVPKSALERRPVVVWNMTRRCNLACIHCYTDSSSRDYPDELTTEEAKLMLKDLADFRVPAVLFSGGEPLLRHDFFEVAEYAAGLGLRLTLSTNGTTITLPVAQRLKDTGFSYVGISLDGIGPTNDVFRGKTGAFDWAVRGIKNCMKVGQKVGVRRSASVTRPPAGHQGRRPTGQGRDVRGGRGPSFRYP